MTEMLQFVIAVFNVGDSPDAGAPAIHPLNARSLALSALLGTHPPRLPARALVALGELFGIAPGTMRTALSRLAANGDVTVADGRYHLAGSLLERQRAQDTGRSPAAPEWDGTWHTIITGAGPRTLTERRRFRRRMADHRFAELRTGIWMRPANLSLPSPPTETGPGDGSGDGAWMAVTGPLARQDPVALATRLWDLATLADDARRLHGALGSTVGEAGGPDRSEAIPERFAIAAAVLRFLRAEPLLPPELVSGAVPGEWPVDALRRRYTTVEAELQRLLRDFFRAAG